MFIFKLVLTPFRLALVLPFRLLRIAVSAPIRIARWFFRLQRRPLRH